ncbi:MAG: hypothetical protein CM15mP130_2240 [Verrucomicrobiota bacterium]|nr:MAG: hypothetical protein CM15mP130_2240 [Verrucomicrobiota bacterium]
MDRACPIMDKDGKYVRRSAYTVLHNGVLIQDNMEVGGGEGKTGHLRLQDQGKPPFDTEIFGTAPTVSPFQ